MSYFQGKRVFLVGGSEGIGLATAKALAAAGAAVVVAARRQGPLDACVSEMQGVNGAGRYDCISLDVTDREAVRAAVGAVEEKLGGPVDVLITNVGAARPGYIVDLEDDDYDRMIAINYTGHVNVVRAFLPAMAAGGGGDICLVTSALGFFSTPGYSAYSASKYALSGFAESLRMEAADHGIRVTLFYPGTTDTPGLKSENEAKPKAVWKMESESAFNTIYKPEQVATRLLKAIQRGRFENFPGFDVLLMWFVYKRFPSLARYLADQEWRTALKKVQKEEAEASGT